MNYAIFASYGNDSIALIQFAREKNLQGVCVVYSNTGWAAPYWPERVRDAEVWVTGLGFQTVQLDSEGMEGLIDRKKAWPRGGGGKYQFCTEALKIAPALKWLDDIDPDKEIICMTGIRREESANRANADEYVEESEAHGGRLLWSPLVRHLEAERNALIMSTPFDVLPNKSKECWPCVNARKKEIAALSDGRVAEIRVIEARAGINSKGNPRVMFSPKRHLGAVGIDQVVTWARNPRTKEVALDPCSSGYCGG